MDIFNLLSLTWIPCLVLFLLLQVRIIRLKKLLVTKYGFEFPKKVFSPIKIDELRGNYASTESVSLKETLSKLIASKKLGYWLILIGILSYLAPILLKMWLSSPNR